jgi:hypothetical protein
MSDKKETAVYWLIKQMSLEDVCKYSRQLGVAKEKEKQQIMQAYIQGFSECDTAEICGPIKYYSETYEQ